MHSADGQFSGTKSYAGLILACCPPLPPISPTMTASLLFSHSYPISDGAPPSKFAAPCQRAKLSLLTFPFTSQLTSGNPPHRVRTRHLLDIPCICALSLLPPLVLLCLLGFCPTKPLFMHFVSPLFLVCLYS